MYIQYITFPAPTVALIHRSQQDPIWCVIPRHEFGASAQSAAKQLPASTPETARELGEVTAGIMRASQWDFISIIYICVYVCMYVCNICMYVCMYVCM